MTIFMAANEMDALDGSAVAITSNSNNKWDATFCRGAIRVNGNVDPISYTLRSSEQVAEGDTTGTWVHFRVHFAATATGDFDNTFFEMSTDDSSAPLACGLYCVNGDLGLRIGRAGNATIQSSITSPFYSLNANQTFEFDVNYRYDGTNATMSVYLGGALIATKTYSTTGNSCKVTGANFKSANHTGTASNRYAYFSEIIIANEDTRGMRVGTREVKANGTLQEQTTGSVGSIDEQISANNADSVAFTSAGKRASFTVQDVSGALTGYDIAAVFVNLRCKASVSRDLQGMAYINSSAYYTTSAVASNAYIGRSLRFTNNPRTNTPWTVSAFNAAEFGFRST